MDVDVLPVGLPERIALALTHYRRAADHRAVMEREHAAVDRVTGLIRKVRREIALGLKGPQPAISDLFAWQFDRLATQIDEMFNDFKECGIDIDEDLIGVPGVRHRRKILRHAVMRELETAGIALGSAIGPAGRAVAFVLSEADRLDGVDVKTRLNLNGTEWRAWVNEYRAWRARKPKNLTMRNVRIY